jgi:uncharacterized delta-60 repeat protein
MTIQGVTEHLGLTVSRYTIDGNADTTFGAYGRRIMGVGACVTYPGVDNIVTDLVGQPDGKILGVGYGTYCYGGICGNTNLEIFRLQGNGHADSTFGRCGLLQSYDILGAYPVTLTFSRLSKVRLLPGGKFLVAGFGQAGGSNTFPFIARLNSDGTVDGTYGVGGFSTITGAFTNMFESDPSDVLVDSSGNSIAIGTSIRLITGYYPFGEVVRVNASGVRDMTFGTGGITTLAYGAANTLTAIKQRTDGKYVVIGSAGGAGTLTYLNTDGTIDSAIIPSGYASIPLPGYPSNHLTSFVMQPDNKILVAGYGKNGYSACAYIGRLNEDGTYDPSFNGYGFDTFNYGVYTHWESGTFLTDIKIVCGNKIMAVGGITPSSTSPNRGTFIVRMKDVDTTSCTYVPLPLKTQILNTNNEINVFPNPANDVLTIQAGPMLNGYFTITNAMGQVFMRNMITASVTELSVRALPAGVYFVTVYGDHSTAVKKVVKM